MHHSLVSIALLTIAEKILAQNDCPMLLKSISASLKEAFTLETNLLLQFELILTEIVDNHVLDRGTIILVECHNWRAWLDCLT